MRKIALFPLFATLLLVSACDSENNEFPGFIPLNKGDDKSTYLYDPKTIGDGEDGAKRVQLLTKLEDGYVIQPFYANCDGEYVLGSGSFYSYEDKSREDYIVEEERAKTESNNDFKKLSDKICSATSAKESETSSSNFEAEKKRYAKEKNVSTSDIIFTSQEKLISADNHDYKVDFYSINHKGNDCHACEGINGIKVFQKNDSDWKLTQSVYDFTGASKGGWGNPPELEWIKNRNGNVMLSIKGSYFAQGESSQYVTFHRLTGGELSNSDSDPKFLVISQDIKEFKIFTADDLRAFYFKAVWIENGIPKDMEYEIFPEGKHFIFSSLSSEASSYDPMNSSGFLTDAVYAKYNLSENSAGTMLSNGDEVKVTGITKDKKFYAIKHPKDASTLFVETDKIALFD